MSTASAPAPTGKEGRGSGAMAVAQRIGRSLMLPIATLPAAALMVRLGHDDMLGREGLPAVAGRVAEFLAAGGGALLDNLPLLFAVGIAVGFARRADGSTGLAAVVGYLVFQRVMAVFDDPNLPPQEGVSQPADAGVLG
ncbi:MAG TPA: PTS transporter subunit EIIC, partial [Streptomyces sp.]|nr:PTS transporter subunit EIIC [Streptomyces sp.]